MDRVLISPKRLCEMGIPFTSAEARTWWVDGACRLVGPHPDTPDDLPDTDIDLAAIEPGRAIS
ncbi:MULTISPECIES: ATP-grasp domain-containing protein [unclassified Amycolatopsis]|uniref:ATP-grasp domain-containing protein n=1 Tax=unclassified Amycolatopsis TaxID=2618356 RepID=UPI002107B9CB|nr:ATP-grasp domain-containing protein [Amycolatopsis sp. DSM 110486]